MHGGAAARRTMPTETCRHPSTAIRAHRLMPESPKLKSKAEREAAAMKGMRGEAEEQ